MDIPIQSIYCYQFALIILADRKVQQHIYIQWHPILTLKNFYGSYCTRLSPCFPTSIRSDLGTSFHIQLTKEFYSTWKIDQQFSVTSHHESNDLVERKIRSFEKCLRLFIEPPTEWISLIPFAEFYINASASTSLGGLSSIELDYGYSPRSPADFAYPTEISVLDEVIDLTETLDRFARSARAALNALHENNNDFYDFYDHRHKNVEFEVGDTVFVDVSMLKAADAVNKQLPRSPQTKLGDPYKIN